jgi:hypothetical protein
LTHALVVVFAGLLGFTTLAAQMCKWTDEDGTVHYAEQCPEDVNGKNIELTEGPTREAVEAAKARSQALAEARAAREASSELDVDEERFLDDGDAAGIDRAIQCVTALREQRILGLRLPVFYDENGQLHYNRSQFDYVYQGPRAYIDDADRPAALADAAERSDRYCGDSDDELALQRVAAAAMLDADLCRDWKARADRLRRSRKPGSREMAQWLENRCR